MAKSNSNYPPNDAKRVKDTRSKGQCQRCHAKTPLASQKKVVRDGDEIKISKANAESNHYCADCAPVRKAELERGIARRAQVAKGGGRKAGAQKASTKRSQARGKSATKAASKKGAKAKTSKATASKKADVKADDGDPF